MTPASSLPFTIDGHSFDMLLVQGGAFHMGSDKTADPVAFDDEQPQHKVTVSDYYMGQFPVTQALWKAVMGAANNPSFFTGDQKPVELVSWNDIVTGDPASNMPAFLETLNEKTKISRPPGLTFRLPTEAEWEYAARGGRASKGYRYAGSDKLLEVGWFDNNSHGETKPVGLLAPNELGLYDMSGNVWEWCTDWFDSNYYSQCAEQDAVENPHGPAQGTGRVYRGGGWLNIARICRAANRGHWRPDHRLHGFGFRLALSLQSVG